MTAISRLLIFAGCLTAAAAILSSPAASAELNYPLAIVANDAGDVYLADRNLPGVWRLKDGELSLYFEGSKKFRTPLNAVRCLAFDKDGKLLAGDSSTREVYRFDDAKKPVPLTAGGIGIPMGIAVNKSGELLVSDLEVHCIWKVPAEGGKPAKLADVPAPSGVCIDAEDNLWVVSRGKEQLYRVSPDGKVEALIKSRVLQFPHNVVLDKQNTGGEPAKWASGEPLDNPVGLAWQGESLLVVDPRAKAVFQIDTAGKITKLEWK
jgi:streptogramin lyase